MNIQLDPASSPQYLIMFNNGTTRAISAADMPSFIPKPVVTLSDSTHLLLPFLQPGSKITYECNCQYHKGFLSRSPDGAFSFSYKSHINKKTKDWGAPLPNLTSTWQDLCIEGILIPGHQSSSFQQPRAPHDNPASARFVSAINLKLECPHLLLTGLHPTHPNCNTWMASFCKEETGIRSQNTYIKINLAKY
jgi:hypothetical protein